MSVPDQHTVLIDARTRDRIDRAIEIVSRFNQTGSVACDDDMPSVIRLLASIRDTPPPPPPDWDVHARPEPPRPSPPDCDVALEYVRRRPVFDALVACLAMVGAGAIAYAAASAIVSGCW